MVSISGVVKGVVLSSVVVVSVFSEVVVAVVVLVVEVVDGFAARKKIYLFTIRSVKMHS